MLATRSQSEPEEILLQPSHGRDKEEGFLVSIYFGQVRFYLTSRLTSCHSNTKFRFSAALTGLPTIMAEADISTEYPANVDDENVTETGFVPTPPEEATRMSSALALFSVSRILNKVLERLYPSSTGYEISLSTIHSLAEELEDWLKKLPSHLRLEFAQDKPSANTSSSRSPLLVSSSKFNS